MQRLTYRADGVDLPLEGSPGLGALPTEPLRDTTLGVSCALVRGDDDVVRCLPSLVSATPMFSDDVCSQMVFEVDAATFPGGAPSVVEIQMGAQREYHKLGAKQAVATVYARLPSPVTGTCQKLFDVPVGADIYALDPAFPPTAFQTFTAKIE